MQSISLGSLKLEAHHDKITNEVALTTKLIFLSKEIDFLRDLKEEAEVVQMMVKPTPNSQKDLDRTGQRIVGIREGLEHEVVKTRREIALRQMQSNNHFEGEIEESYEIAALKIAERLQKIEDCVQKREDQKRLCLDLGYEQFVPFREKNLKLLVERNLQRRQGVKQQLRRRLMLGGKIHEKEDKLRQNAIATALRSGLSLRCLNFLRKEKRYYPSKSAERLNLQPHSPNNIRDKYCNSASRQQIPLKRIQKDEGTGIHPSLLASFEDQLYEQGLYKLKIENSQLQLKIDVIKAALERRQSLQTFHLLAKEQDIQTQRAKARQILAFMEMDRNFKDKLQTCSHRWALQPKILTKSNINISKQWSQQPSNSFFNGLMPKKQRSRSMVKPKQECIAQSFSRGEPFKSYEKTNASLERF